VHFTPKMEPTWSSETFVSYCITTLRNNTVNLDLTPKLLVVQFERTGTADTGFKRGVPYK